MEPPSAGGRRRRRCLPGLPFGMRHGGSIRAEYVADIAFTTTAAATTEAFVNPVAAELAGRGHRIHLITGDRPPEADYSHTSAVLRMNRGMSPTADLDSLRRWVSHLRAARPRMIVAGTPKASLLGLAAARAAGVPTRVYVIHGAVWDGASGSRQRMLETAERATIASSTNQLAVSDSLARLVHARGLSRRMPDVLGSGSFCGVDTEQFRPPDRPLHPDKPVMCFVGRLNRDKGIDVLLRTLDRVRDHVDATLTIIGGLDSTAPPSPEVMSALETNPHVNFVGEVSDVAPHIQRATILLFASAREGLPQVPLEAQACGVPVISWRVTGVIDAVRDGFTGTLVAFGDEVCLASAAVEMLSDAGLRARTSANARALVTDRFERLRVVAANVEYLEAQLQAT